MPSDYAQEIDIWPENWPAVDLFVRLSTQWIHSFRGKEGLNYLVMFAMVDRIDLSPCDREFLIEDVQHLERAALTVLRQT